MSSLTFKARATQASGGKSTARFERRVWPVRRWTGFATCCLAMGQPKSQASPISSLPRYKSASSECAQPSHAVLLCLHLPRAHFGDIAAAGVLSQVGPPCESAINLKGTRREEHNPQEARVYCSQPQCNSASELFGCTPSYVVGRDDGEGRHHRRVSSGRPRPAAPSWMVGRQHTCQSVRVLPRRWDAAIVAMRSRQEWIHRKCVQTRGRGRHSAAVAPFIPISFTIAFLCASSKNSLQPRSCIASSRYAMYRPSIARDT